jgi:hypothetical protein
LQTGTVCFLTDKPVFEIPEGSYMDEDEDYSIILQVQVFFFTTKPEW